MSTDTKTETSLELLLNAADAAARKAHEELTGRTTASGPGNIAAIQLMEAAARTVEVVARLNPSPAVSDRIHGK